LPGLPEQLLPDSLTAVRLAAGVLLLGAGFFLAIAGLFNLGRSLTIVPRPKDDAVLVQNGAYRIVRHPIYSGLILGSFGWALLVNGPLTFVYALLLAVVLDIKSRREEQWLNDKYPDYAAYQQRVHKLVPFIY
jgi:protein-S-isoprenylcysteine O-methyltransferase Ste14